MVQASQRFMIVRVLLAVLLGASFTIGAEFSPVDLRPHLGKNQFQNINAEWLVPTGSHHIVGVPFQISGIVEISGTSSRFSNPGRSNITDIKIDQTFERVHLLLAASRGGIPSGTAFAAVKLHYADGSESTLNLEYDRHARDWFGPRHREEGPLLDPTARIIWQAQHPAAAKRDDEIRLFYVGLANPQPAKPVRALALQSLKQRSGLMVAAISVGKPAPDAGTNTLAMRPLHQHPEEGAKVALAGKVSTPAGAPIAGALVRILGVRPPGTNEMEFATDAPRVGLEQMSDEGGSFRFPEVPAAWVYKLLVASTNYQALLYEGADPGCGHLEVRLPERKTKIGTNNWFVHARVIGPDDKPVIGATVEIDGVGTDDSTSWGGSHGFENTVTDPNGEFVMARSNRFTRLSVDIAAAGLAPAKNVWLPSSNGLQTVRMGIGARLIGRIIHEGKPLPRVKVGISGSERNSEVYAGNYEAVTDAEGRFEFKHVPPDTQWWFYGHMNSLKKFGELSVRPHKSGDHSSVADLGELTLSQGLRLAGIVKTKSGAPVPKGLKLRAGYDTAWDSQEATVREDGSFRFEGLHSGQLEIAIADQKWKLSPDNKSLSVYNPWYLSGLLESDKTNLVVLIEPGSRNYRNVNSGNGNLPPQDNPERLPLGGIESDGSVPIRVSGMIVDAETGKRLTANVIRGRKPPITTAPAPPATLLETITKPFRKTAIPWNEMPFWYFYHEEPITNGAFDLQFQRLSSTPMLRVLAKGYQEEDFGPFPTSTNLVLRLQRGGGPRGVILQPDGKPAAKAKIIYSARGEQHSLKADGVLDNYAQDTFIATVPENGEFNFEVRKEGLMLFAAHPTGYAAAMAEDYLKGGTLQLQPWAVVTGTLVTSNGPVAGEKMCLSMPTDWRVRDPFVNLQERPTTDAQGNFTFLRAPPGEFELHRLVPMGRPSSGHSLQLQTPVYNKPGMTNNLGRVQMDTPPPPSVWKEWKKKLGL